MKKTIISIAAAALCMSAFPFQAFAADILSNRNVYSADGEQLAKTAENLEWGFYIDPNTVMPVYEARILDYAQTGVFDLKPRMVFDGQQYIANALNEKGEFVGLVEFTVDGIHPGIGTYYHITDESRTAEYIPNAKRIKAAMIKQGIDTDCKEIKLAFVHDLGYVYYINNGESAYLSATGMFDVNAEALNEENGGIIEIGDELKDFADRTLAKYEEYKREVLDKLPADTETPPSGGIEPPPTFMADNTPYLDGTETPTTSGNNSTGNTNTNDNPNTGGVSSALAGGIALTTCVIGISAAKKKKK